MRVGGQIARKPSDPVKPDDEVLLTAPERYVSRGGYKLEHGLRHFQVEARGVTAIDLGASTGGFTDCLLQQGAALVYAVDVGRGQLAWKLRRDPRVVVMEKTNARSLTRAQFSPNPLTGRICSWPIVPSSRCKIILPPAVALLRHCGRILALVKPQFEAGQSRGRQRRRGHHRPGHSRPRLAEAEGICRRATAACIGAAKPRRLFSARRATRNSWFCLKKKPEKFRKIGLIANFDKAASRDVVLRAAALIARTGRAVMAEQTARMAGLRCATSPNPAALAREAGLLLVFGGDGTMLRVVHEIHGSDTPILGINIGRLGFLTAVTSRDLPGALQKIWQNDFVIESRPLIEAACLCQGKPIQMPRFQRYRHQPRRRFARHRTGRPR